MSSDNFIIILKRAWSLLDTRFQGKSILVLIGIWVNSMLEIIGLAAILPVLAATLKDGFIHENPYLHMIYEVLSFSSNRKFIFFLCASLLAIIIIKNIFGVLIQKLQYEYCWDIHQYLSAQVMQSAYQKGFTYFMQNNSNKVFNEIAGIPMQFARQVLTQALQLINEIFVLLMIMISLLAYDSIILIILALVILPIFFTFYQLTKKKITRQNRVLNALIPQTNKPVFELSFGYVDVVIGGVFSFFKNEYTSKIEKAKKFRTHLLVVQNVPNRLIEICVVLAVIIIVLYAVFLLENTTSVVTLLSIFGLAAYRTIPSVNRLMNSVIGIKGQQYAIEILESFLKDQSQPEASLINQPSRVTLNKAITINNLCFKFPDAQKAILKDISFKIAQGETIGLAGKSGSGKTTLMNLMLGFLSPDQGEIFIDDVELSQENLPQWHSLIGYVRQDVFLIDGSLIENVAFGIPEDQIDLQRFQEVIEKAQLTEVLNELEDGAQGHIGERGNKLSGGQRQRVGIARALYHGAEVLFFDEATSALDTVTEEEITQSIRHLKEEKITMIIIAHRDSTLRYCDRIYEVGNQGLRIKETVQTPQARKN